MQDDPPEPQDDDPPEEIVEHLAELGFYPPTIWQAFQLFYIKAGQLPGWC